MALEDALVIIDVYIDFEPRLNTGGPSSRYEYVTKSKHLVNILRNRNML